MHCQRMTGVIGSVIDDPNSQKQVSVSQSALEKLGNVLEGWPILIC